METPNVPVGFIPAKEGDIINFPGGGSCRIQEDGSRTDNRIGCAVFTIPPNTKGPPAHWHEMHDEVFLIEEGTIRFHTKDGNHKDATKGDLIVVPPRAPHTFSNPTDQPAVFFNTFTPAYYIQYFKLMDTWIKNGRLAPVTCELIDGANIIVLGDKMDPEMVKKAMAYFATIGVDGPL